MPPKRLTKENIDDHSAMMSRKSFESGPLPLTTQPQMRRPSKWAPSLADRRLSTVSRKTSISGQSYSTKPAIPVKYENTFKLEPDSRFESHRARNIMLATLKEYLDGTEYSASVRNVTTSLSEEIKKRVKALGYARYKYVVTVTVCQDAHQSMQMVSRCMWNKDTDTFAEAVFRSNDIHAVATLYALYYE